MIITGLIYSWSVFIIPLESEFGWIRSQTSLTFSISIASFCLGGIIGGILSKKYTTKILLCLSGTLVFLGFILASRINNLFALYIYYGVFIGLGIGICYNTILNANLKWFPNKQGFISGILLMSFALGGSIFGSVAIFLMKKFGWRNTFLFFGITTFCVIIIGSFYILKPLQAQSKIFRRNLIIDIDRENNYSPIEMVKNPSFIVFYIWSILLSASGLALISNAVPFANTYVNNMETATLLAGLISVLNGVGRLSFGFLFDALGSRKCIFIISICFILSGLILILAFQFTSLVLLTLGFVCSGFSYGGVTPTNSAFVGKYFGDKNYATNFSIITTVAFVSAFLGPYIVGFLYNLGNSYYYLTIMIFAFSLISIICIVFIKK